MAINNPNTKLLGKGILEGKKRTLTKQLDFSTIDETFVGTFIFHHPTVLDRMNIGTLKSQLLQGMEGRTDVITDNIAHMTAVLSHVIDEAPEWFKINEIYDYEILDTVYETYNEWVNTFRK